MCIDAKTEVKKIARGQVFILPSKLFFLPPLVEEFSKKFSH
jgi:hypothetical protein